MAELRSHVNSELFAGRAALRSSGGVDNRKSRGMITSVESYVNDWVKEGYGVALVDVVTEEILQPYFDFNDRPDLRNKAVSIHTGNATIDGTSFRLELHTGPLEEKYYEQQRGKK